MKKETQEKIKNIVKETISEAVLSRYIECPKCGNMVLKANAIERGCCGLIFDKRVERWRVKPKDDEDIDSLDLDLDLDEDEEESEGEDDED